MADWIKELFKLLLEAGWELAKEYSPEIMKAIRGWWSNKTLAIIGPTACGKDSLLARLQGKPVPKQHINTGAPEEVKAYEINYSLDGGEEVSFKANKTLNVGGEENDREDYWADVCKGADVIFYMVDAQRLRDEHNSFMRRIQQDMRWLAAEGLNNPNAKLIIVLNKFDLLLDGKEPENLEDAFLNLGAPLATEVQNIAIKELKAKAECLKGVMPLSTTDGYLFSQLFPPILRAATK